MNNTQMKKFVAWKTTGDCEPINGTERVLLGRSQRSVIRFLATESGVEVAPGALIARMPDGTMWAVSRL